MEIIVVFSNNHVNIDRVVRVSGIINGLLFLAGAIAMIAGLSDDEDFVRCVMPAVFAFTLLFTHWSSLELKVAEGLDGDGLLWKSFKSLKSAFKFVNGCYN